MCIVYSQKKLSHSTPHSHLTEDTLSFLPILPHPPPPPLGSVWKLCNFPLVLLFQEFLHFSHLILRHGYSHHYNQIQGLSHNIVQSLLRSSVLGCLKTKLSSDNKGSVSWPVFLPLSNSDDKNSVVCSESSVSQIILR